MGGIISRESAPPPPPPPPSPPPPPPERDDSPSRSDVADERKRTARARGRTGTILTSGSGVDTDDTLIKKKSLLGGGSAAA